MAEPPTDRLFFAVLPDAQAREVIDALAWRLHDELGLKSRPAGRERYHVTLNFLGDHVGLPAALVEQAARCAAAVAQPAFEVRFDRVGSFARPRHSPLVLLGGEGTAGLNVLTAALGESLGAWIDPPRRRYTPHLTLLRDDRVVVERPIEPVGWVVQEFVLVHSVLRQHRHTVLGRWPLRAAAAGQRSSFM